VIANLCISAAGVRELQRLGWLAAERSNDPQAVAQAILAAAGAATTIGLTAGAFRRPAADRQDDFGEAGHPSPGARI
jgi:hypothetical protein